MRETLGGEDASEAFGEHAYIDNTLACNVQVLAQYIPCLAHGNSIWLMSVDTEKALGSGAKQWKTSLGQVG